MIRIFPQVFLFALIAMINAVDAAPDQLFGVSPEGNEEGGLVQGVAPISSGNVGDAREAAINRALAMAVEQRLGFSLESQRKMSNHALIADRLEKEAQGDVAEYTIVKEEARDGNYWVTLDVTLVPEKIREAGLDRVRLGIITQTEAGNAEFESDRLARDLLQQELAEADFTIFPSVETLKFDSSSHQIRDVAVENNWDAVLLIDTRTKERNEIGGLHSYRTRARAKLVLAGNGRLAWQETQSAIGQRRSYPEEAAHSSLQNAIQPLARDMAFTMTHQYERMVAVRLSISGIASRRLSDVIQNGLEKVEGVSSVRQTSYEDNQSRFDLVCDPMTARLIPDKLRTIPGVDVEIMLTHGMTIIAEMQK